MLCLFYIFWPEPEIDPFSTDDLDDENMQPILESDQIEAASITFSPTSPYFVHIENAVGYDPEEEDPENRRHRHEIQKMFRHAFNGYADRCFGKGEVRPISGTCTPLWREFDSYAVQPDVSLGLTLIDSLDTLLIMGETALFKKSRDWIAKRLTFHVPVAIGISVFEITIRSLGGLLSAHQMTKDSALLKKATELADILLGAFGSPSRIPCPMVVLRGHGGCGAAISNIAEAGSLSVEFGIMSYASKNVAYITEALGAMKSIYQFRPGGLLPVTIKNIKAVPLEFVGDVSVGSMGDSFYEYLLKYYLLGKRKDTLMGQWWEEASKDIIDSIKLITIGETEMAYIDTGANQGHLECFAGGLFALASVNTEDEQLKERYLTIGKQLGAFCQKMYTLRDGEFEGLPVEGVMVRDGGLVVSNWGFHQRPEAVESWFYLWRITGDQIYRKWGWEYAQALKTTEAPHGYFGLTGSGREDIQQSFFLSETLKYLYLLFCPNDVLPLDKFVFSTEGHPFQIFDVKESYDFYLDDIDDLRVSAKQQ